MSDPVGYLSTDSSLDSLYSDYPWSLSGIAPVRKDLQSSDPILLLSPIK